MVNLTANQRFREKGFTLTEIIVGMVILGLITVIAIPKITSALNNIILNAAAQKMLSDIRYAREVAISRHSSTTGTLYGVEFNQTTNSYSVFQLSGGSKTVITDPYRRNSMTLNYSARPEYNGVSISSASACAGVGCLTQEIRFNAFGTPTDSQNTAFTSAVDIVLARGSVTKTVRVTQQTAYAELI